MLEPIETVAALRERLARHSEGKDAIVGFVPTMGALHAGHAALIDAARGECTIVVVSIFVNPLQFNSQDDLATYPRTLEADVAFCRQHHADVVFAPSASEVYPAQTECSVDVGRLGNHLCGAFRPGHFRGVATVVLKLFNIVRPHRAYFGEKDAQQLAIIKRLVADFNLVTDVVGVATVREADGLAMSSRNRHLIGAEREVAPCLYRALTHARGMIAGGERKTTAIRSAAAAMMPTSEILKLEYFEIVDPETLQPVAEINGPVRVAGALWVGTTRLIDNVLALP